MSRRSNQPRVRRQADRRLARVGLFSVAVVSLIVAVLTAAMIFGAGLLLWRYGVGTGVVERAEEIVGNFTADGTFTLDGPTLFAAWLAVATMWALVMTALGILLAVIVNVACFLTGGVRLRFRWYAPAPARRALPHAPESSELAGQQQLDLEAVSGTATAVLSTNGSGSGSRGRPPRQVAHRARGHGHRERTPAPGAAEPEEVPVA